MDLYLSKIETSVLCPLDERGSDDQWNVSLSVVYHSWLVINHLTRAQCCYRLFVEQLSSDLEELSEACSYLKNIWCWYDKSRRPIEQLVHLRLEQGVRFIVNHLGHSQDSKRKYLEDENDTAFVVRSIWHNQRGVSSDEGELLVDY